MRVLIAYASKHDATAEIAMAVASILRKRGLDVDVRDVSHIEAVSPYDAVIVGSAVYMGNWMKSAVQFIETFADDLSQNLVWLFSSGPTGEGDPVELLKGVRYPDALKPIIERIQPVDIALFHGRLDQESLSFGEKLITKMVKAPEGDFRNWEMINQWADKIAEALTSEKAAT